LVGALILTKGNEPGVVEQPRYYITPAAGLFGVWNGPDRRSTSLLPELFRKDFELMTKKRNGIDGADLEPNHDFAWALTQMKAGRTVVRESWLPQMGADAMGRSETHFVALIPRQEHAEFDKVQEEFLTGHVKDLLVPAHFVRGTILGLWEPGWVPSAEELLAEDWRLGHREYAIYCDKLWRKRRVKKAG
jgi:hypothetical protein